MDRHGGRRGDALAATPPASEDGSAFTPEHLAELQAAAARLSALPFWVRVAHAVGRPLESSVAALPAPARRALLAATRTALDRGLDWAVATLRPGDRAAGPPWVHRAVVTASGGVGGALGWSALAVELPFSTVVMLRSLASIAREYGEDPTDPVTRLECLAVLAYGGPSRGDDGAETAYYATRASLATTLPQAATHLATAAAGGEAPRAARVVAAFLAKVGGRFGVVVQEKAIAQTVPIVGALGGATLNHLFLTHFETVARGHFALRRLERTYGEAAVREAYRRATA